MTLGEGKRKVLKLLDEYSSGGTLTTDRDIENKMTDFFDMAQKDVAKFRPIYKEQTYTLQGSGEQLLPLPEDCAGIFRVHLDGLLFGRYAQRGKFIAVSADAGETLLLQYKAVPGTIPTDAADDYAFEVDEEAAACMPFYVASMQLIPDLVVDWGGYWSIYQNMLANLELRIPASGSSGVRQALFAGGRRRRW